MNVLSLLGMFVYAAEIIISPLPADFDKPEKSFSEIGSSPAVVLGIGYDQYTQTATISIPTPTPTTAPTATPTRTPTPSPTSSVNRAGKLRQTTVKIALLGDSMTDTLGPEFPELQKLLKQYYPTIQPVVLNYGVGATNIDYGIERITRDYEYLGKSIPALASQQPDIIVLESFGYNPYSFETGAIDKHWLALSQAVDVIKQTIPQAKIVVAATIAPNANVFGDGAANIAFDAEEKWNRVNVIKQYLESTTRFATGQKYPLADAYHPSLQADGNGNPTYINAGDHIHTSPEGRAFIAEILTKTLVEHKLLE